ncbi:MAG: c-type cytochrome [Acidobacteria bacterium]|nr:c-type cytochrome [Acidobacteriota bacterium]
MPNLQRILLFGSICGLFAAGTAAQENKVEYGRYLVEEVAKCHDCHTPKLPNGELDRSRWLKGATLDFQPMTPIERWHKTSPDLTPKGRLWQRWGEEAILKYLQTGLTPKGNPADPPMPGYKLKPKDAEAVLEYLKTLK